MLASAVAWMPAAILSGIPDWWSRQQLQGGAIPDWGMLLGRWAICVLGAGNTPVPIEGTYGLLLDQKAGFFLRGCQIALPMRAFDACPACLPPQGMTSAQGPEGQRQPDTAERSLYFPPPHWKGVEERAGEGARKHAKWGLGM